MGIFTAIVTSGPTPFWITSRVIAGNTHKKATCECDYRLLHDKPFDIGT